MIESIIFLNIREYGIYIHTPARFLCVPPHRIGEGEQNQNKGNPIHLLRSSIY